MHFILITIALLNIHLHVMAGFVPPSFTIKSFKSWQLNFFFDRKFQGSGDGKDSLDEQVRRLHHFIDNLHDHWMDMTYYSISTFTC